MVTTQLPLPVHAPVHPVKVEPVVAEGVSVTCVPLLKLALHVVPQLIPAGLLVTVPLPVPAFVTVKGKVVGLVVKVAVTDCAAFIVTTQLPLPLHAPVHPVKVEPVVAVGVSVTCVPLLKLAVHVVPQLIPAGLLVTVPVPVPAFVTVKGKVVGLLPTFKITEALELLPLGSEANAVNVRDPVFPETEVNVAV